MVGVCVIGGAVAYWLASRIGLVAEPASAGGNGLTAMALWLWVLLLVAIGHIGASVWARRRRPNQARVVLTQLPHVAAYLAAIVWWWGTWSALFLLWGYATLGGVAWLTVWYLPAPELARRAVVYLSGLGLLVAVNVAGILALSWQETNGFGFRGQATPWAAFTALAATSCLTRHPFYDNGSNTIAAHCPSGPDADYFAADYDETAFDNMLCDPQPRHAFARWWDWNRAYQLLFHLDWTAQRSVLDGRQILPPYPDRVHGSRATIRYTMTVEHVSTIGATRPHRMRADRTEETWTVQFAPATFGGWKVCRIDIADPITATFTPIDR